MAQDAILWTNSLAQNLELNHFNNTNMKNTLIISGHYDLSRSTANRNIIECLVNEPGVTIRDVKTNYRDLQIDVEAEQRALIQADVIILQSPILWYSLPWHMKLWIEKVLTPGFAYGDGGHKLRGKHFFLSVTVGGSEAAYSKAGNNRYDIETFLAPLEVFARYCGLDYLPPVVSYEMATYPGVDTDKLISKAAGHAERIKQALLNLQNESNGNELLVA